MWNGEKGREITSIPRDRTEWLGGPPRASRQSLTSDHSRRRFGRRRIYHVLERTRITLGRLGRLSVLVSDYEEAIDFYVGRLGFEGTLRWESRRLDAVCPPRTADATRNWPLAVRSRLRRATRARRGPDGWGTAGRLLRRRLPRRRRNASGAGRLGRRGSRDGGERLRPLRGPVREPVRARGARGIVCLSGVR